MASSERTRAAKFSHCLVLDQRLACATFDHVTLVSDLDEANRQLRELHAQLAAKQAEIDAKSLEVEEKAARIAELTEQIAYLRRQIFGRRRETIDPKQLALFESMERELLELTQPAKPKKKPKQGHGRPPFPADLPRNTITLDLPEADQIRPDCGGTMKYIGTEVTERGHIIPARMCVNRYERHKYACTNGHTVRVAPLPDGVVDRGKYEASVYSFVATSKYSDHLPLNRIQQIFKRYGTHLPRQTMWDLLVRLDELVAQPMLKQMRSELLQEQALQTDETPIRVQREGEKGTKQGWLWSWRNVRGSPVEEVVADFRMDRSADGPTEFLGDWSGTLLTDGFDGVNPVAVKNGITRAGCFAHARRKFRDALESGDNRAALATQLIQDLFRIEGDVTARAKDEGLDLTRIAALRLEARNEHSKSVLEQLFDEAFAIDADVGVPRGSRLQKAATYLINQRAALLAHLKHGEIPIHNNDTERDLRHVAVGRKNWMIFGSQRGGEVAARLYSLALSCKLNGVDVQAYLEDVLGLVGTTPASQIAKLTPWGWAAAQDAAPAS